MDLNGQSASSSGCGQSVIAGKENRGNMRSEQPARPGKRPLRALTNQQKLDAIDRVRNGESKASVGRDIEVPESTLRGWCKMESKLRGNAKRYGSSESDVHSQAVNLNIDRLSNNEGSEPSKRFCTIPEAAATAAFLNNPTPSTSSMLEDPEAGATVRDCSLFSGLNGTVGDRRLHSKTSKKSSQSRQQQQLAGNLAQKQEVGAQTAGIDASTDIGRMIDNPAFMYWFQLQLYQQIQRHQQLDQYQAQEQLLQSASTSQPAVKPESSVSPTEQSRRSSSPLLCNRHKNGHLHNGLAISSAQDHKAFEKSKETLDNSHMTLHVSETCQERLPVPARIDAIRCGEIFVTWLRTCLDPNVSMPKIDIIQRLLDKLKKN